MQIFPDYLEAGHSVNSFHGGLPSRDSGASNRVSQHSHGAMLEFVHSNSVALHEQSRTERKMEHLSADELARFRERFLRFEYNGWDRQIEQDLKAGKLDELSKKALAGCAAGRIQLL